VRPVSHGGHRLKEAAKLGFTSAATPASKPANNSGTKATNGTTDDGAKGMSLRSIERIADLVALIAAGKPVRTVERARGDT
jgi:predicted ATP-dependent serine protease